MLTDENPGSLSPQAAAAKPPRRPAKPRQSALRKLTPEELQTLRLDEASRQAFDALVERFDRSAVEARAFEGEDVASMDDARYDEHSLAEDPLVTLARHRIDLHDHVVERWDAAPGDLVRTGHWGWQWQGWRTALERPGVGPRGGLFHAGAHAHPGSSLEMIGEATAAIAAAVGKA